MRSNRESRIIRDALEQYFSDDGPGPKIPPHIARLAALADWDLWYGPISTDPDSPYGPDDGEPWPGFIKAAQEVAKWASSSIPRTLYVDMDAGFAGEQNPWEWEEYYRDPETEEIGDTYYGPEEVYELSYRDILGYLFGSELARGGYLD